MKRTSQSAPPRRAWRTDDAGFTLIEVVVVSVILVTGMLSAFLLLDKGAEATSNSSQRDGANAIAQELVERTAGMRYDAVFNDLVDRGGSSPTGATPAQRLQKAMAPDAAPTTITDSDPARPWSSLSTWDITRGNTTYTVSYTACTDSDAIDGVRVDGPYDCSGIQCPADDDDCRPCPEDAEECTPPEPDCKIALIDPENVQDDEDESSPLEVRLQLLGGFGLELCLTSEDLPLDLSKLTSSLCSLLPGTNSGSVAGLLNGVTGAEGLLSSLQGALNLNLIGANAELCPGAIETDTAAAVPGIASTTHIEVRVDWTERMSGKPRFIRQQTVVRRPAA